MLTVGLTGGIGSGKSMVAKILESLGIPVFYSDEVSKHLVNTDPDIRNGLIERFGEGVYHNNQLNREFLAKAIFSSDDDRKFVNSLIHPRVRNAFDTFKQAQSSNIVVNEAAILFETGAHTGFDKMILVTAPEELRIQRVMDRDGVEETEVKTRVNKQWSDDQKIPLADIVIINDEQQPLLAQVEKVVDELKNYSTSS